VLSQAPTTTAILPSVEQPLDASGPRISSQSTTTSTLSCINSFDSRCGQQRWTPDPGSNTPLRATLGRWSRANAGSVDALTYTIRVEDSDAALTPEDVYFDDSGEGNHYLHGVLLYRQAPGCPKRARPYGTWSTPGRQTGSVEVTYTYYRNSSFPYVEFIEAASDLCSFIRYAPGQVTGPDENLEAGGWTWREPAYFNPYASFATWVVCIESGGRVKLVNWTDYNSSQCEFLKPTATTSPSSTTTSPPSSSNTTSTTYGSAATTAAAMRP
jgi:hypothetical protein